MSAICARIGETFRLLPAYSAIWRTSTFTVNHATGSHPQPSDYASIIPLDTSCALPVVTTFQTRMSSMGPRGVYCYCCPQDFSTLSAMFNHLESGNCSSGIEHDDILALAATFVRSLSPSQGYVFFCIGCRKPFRRMCDLLQHSETSSCDEGYWKGSGHVGSLVTYIASHISELVPEVDGGDMETGHNSPDNDPDKTPRPKFNIPTIVITGPT
ncbi:hypothetical protein FQN49_005277 [Arthroderma sp. PD_2]|nr:hypothetical protein FQN49_005277 [Arthroderma sp. PD_2]